MSVKNVLFEPFLRGVFTQKDLSLMCFHLMHFGAKNVTRKIQETFKSFFYGPSFNLSIPNREEDLKGVFETV